MKPTPVAVVDPRKMLAAESAQAGLVNVADLSLLTGVEVAKLTSFAKKGFLRAYGEYHGKRFFNFNEILNWIGESGVEDEAKQTIRAAVEAELKKPDCPYALKWITSEADGTSTIQILWKDQVAA